jgi:hypothetical protein
MGKKPKKRTLRRHVINDPTLPLLAGIELVQPQPPKPVTAARQRAWQRDRAAWLADEKARAAARRAERAVRLASRPATMQDARYRLPAGLAAWVRTLWQPANVRHHDTHTTGIESIIEHHGVEDAILAAYMEGCRQGYIEGRVADIEPKRERSRKANAARRQKHNLDERDAKIVEKHRRLRAVPLSASETEFRLAEEYGLSDKMIRIIIGKARKAAR